MTTRRITLIALVFAVLVQTGLVVIYHHVTDGCFCQTLRSPSVPIPPAFVVDFLEVASLPAEQFPFVTRLDPLAWGYGRYPIAAGWAAMLAIAAINAVFWFAGAFALMKGIVLLGRIRGPRRAF